MTDETVDVFWAMKPIYYGSKCTLGAPYSIIGDVGSRAFVVKKTDIYLYLLQFVVVIFVFAREMYTSTKYDKDLNIIDILQLIFNDASVDLLLVANILLVSKFTKGVSSILLEIQCLDKELQTPTELEYCKARRFWVSMIVLRYFLYLVVTITSILVFPESLEALIIVMLVNVIDGWTEFQVFFLLNCIRNKFKSTNKLLENCISLRIDSIVLASSNNNYKTIRDGRVKELMDIFDRCRNMCEVINETFGLYIVAKCLNIFGLVVFTLFTSIWMIGMKSENSINIISLAVWVICLFSGITILVIFCELVLYETRKTLNILKEIRSVHQDMSDRIEIYYLRLHHSKVKFTACGFFDVNFAFLNTLIAACSTYYVILLQFQVLDDTLSNVLTYKAVDIGKYVAT